MIKILKHLKSWEWALILLCMVLIFGQVQMDLLIPDRMAAITRLTQTPGSTMSEIWENGAYMLLYAFVSIVFAIAVSLIASIVAASFARRIRSRLFNKVDSFSMEEINRFSTASLITRSTNDVTQVQMLVVLGIQLIFRAIIMAISAVIKIAGKGYEWSLATGISVGILFVLVIFVLIFVMPRFKKMQKLTDNINRVARENLTGLRVVRAYNAEKYQEGKFEVANDELTNNQLFTGRAMSIMMPIIMLVMSGLGLAIYWIGAYLIKDAGIMEGIELFSNMVVFSGYAMQVIMAFMMLAMMFIMLPRASVSAKRINEVLGTKSAIKDGHLTEKDVAPKPGEKVLSGDIEFKNVSFKYPDAAEYVLHDISFKVKQGETVAFIGSTGSGKSTVINLVPRFFDSTEGEVLINGINVRDYTLATLYNKIGYVPQRAVMFKGSVSDNVALGDNGKGSYTEDDVKNAVRIAQSTDFVEKMEDGYNANIAQGGANVSGGQKQRLAIARAVCRKPEIYIFDDSFSALDYKTDRVLRSVLKKETAGVTSMIVAQRIGTIMDADQIVVLDEGRVVGKGTHKELLNTCDVYREIATSQLSEEELLS